MLILQFYVFCAAAAAWAAAATFRVLIMFGFRRKHVSGLILSRLMVLRLPGGGRSALDRAGGYAALLPGGIALVGAGLVAAAKGLAAFLNRSPGPRGQRAMTAVFVTFRQD